jgi:hypothetical protein
MEATPSTSTKVQNADNNTKRVNSAFRINHKVKKSNEENSKDFS